jgi:hypothetical protein
MKTISENFFSIIIIFLLILLVFGDCNGDSTPEEPIIVRDTTWIRFDSIVYHKPEIIDRIHTENHYYIPDSTYEGLLKQFHKIVAEHTMKNVHSDTLKIKDLGYVHVIDTVSENEIKDRKYSYFFEYPEVETTITQPYVPRNQFYMGGGVQSGPVNAFNFGGLLKNKKDNIFKASIGITDQLQLQYGAEAYFKLKF